MTSSTKAIEKPHDVSGPCLQRAMYAYVSRLLTVNETMLLAYAPELLNDSLGMRPNVRLHLSIVMDQLTYSYFYLYLYFQAFGAAAGTFYAACQLAWYPDPIADAKGSVKGHSLKGIMRTIARPTFWMSAAATAFAAAECTAEAARGKKDSWNASIGGLAAGAVLGATTKRFDMMTSSALGMGLFMFALDMTGPSTVHESGREELHYRRNGTLPEKHQESEALSALKTKYPKHANL